MNINFKRILAGVLAASCICGLSGCIVYTKDDLATYTKKRLKEEYGEEFEIKTVIDDSNTIAYPVNNPDLLFETSYVIGTNDGRNEYLEEIVAQQFKELIEEKLADFKYKYYVDVDVDWTNALGKADTNITIEEFDKLKGARPNHDIFLSCEALAYTDEELYSLIKSMASIHDCFIRVYFITDEYFIKLADNFSIYPTLIPSLYRDLKYTFDSVGLATVENGNGELKKDFSEFEVKMKKIRNNELYR